MLKHDFLTLTTHNTNNFTTNKKHHTHSSRFRSVLRFNAVIDQTALQIESPTASMILVAAITTEPNNDVDAEHMIVDHNINIDGHQHGADDLDDDDDDDDDEKVMLVGGKSDDTNSFGPAEGDASSEHRLIIDNGITTTATSAAVITTNGGMADNNGLNGTNGHEQEHDGDEEQQQLWKTER